MLRVRPLVALTSATFAVGLGELAGPEFCRRSQAISTSRFPPRDEVVGAYALVFAVLTPPLAAAFSGARRKRGLIVGTGDGCVANVLAAVAPAYALLLCARLRPRRVLRSSARSRSA